MPVHPTCRPAPAALGLLLAAWAGGCGGPGKAPDTGEPPPDTGTTPVDSVDTGSGTGLPGRPEFDCYSELTIDEDLDGAVDGTGYDGWDPAHPTWQVYRERDYNGNGIPESFATWSRDAAGNVLRFEQWGNDPWTYDATYDEDGNRTSYEEDGDGDGDIDVVYRYEYENGALVRLERDDGADGSLDYVATYVRDAEGRRLSAEEDEDGDGQTDTWYTYTLDELGRETGILADEGNDGEVDRTTTTVYTDPVLLVGTRTVTDAAGAVIQIEGFAYDEENRELYYAFDIVPPVDGAYDYERWSERDENGAIVMLRELNSLHGPQLETVQDVTYDGLGRTVFVQIESRNLTAGTLDLVVTYAYAFGGTCPSP